VCEDRAVLRQVGHPKTNNRHPFMYVCRYVYLINKQLMLIILIHNICYKEF
jgi:hypothetical protein